MACQNSEIDRTGTCSSGDDYFSGRPTQRVILAGYRCSAHGIIHRGCRSWINAGCCDPARRVAAWNGLPWRCGYGHALRGSSKAIGDGSGSLGCRGRCRSTGTDGPKEGNPEESIGEEGQTRSHNYHNDYKSTIHARRQKCTLRLPPPALEPCEPSFAHCANAFISIDCEIASSQSYWRPAWHSQNRYRLRQASKSLYSLSPRSAL